MHDFSQNTQDELNILAAEAQRRLARRSAHRFKLVLAMLAAVLLMMTLAAGEPDAAWKMAAVVMAVVLGALS